MEQRILNLKCLDNFKRTYKKVYVLVIGGSASGKNFYAEQTSYPIVDIDKINEELNNGKKNVRTTIGKAKVMVENKVKEYFSKGESFLQITVGTSEKTIKNKIDLAKENGYTVILMHIRCTVDQAYKNNLERISKGGHGKTIPKFKILASNLSANYIYGRLKQYADFCIQIVSGGGK